MFEHFRSSDVGILTEHIKIKKGKIKSINAAKQLAYDQV
jgi:hypothetical protein